MEKYSTPAWANGSTPAINAAALTAMGQAIELSEHPYGVCSTAAATAAKVVTVDFTGTLTLFPGLSVKVRFSNANTADSPTLSVNGTAAKSIVSPGYIGTVTWAANAVIIFTYNGSQWVFYTPDAYTKNQSLSDATKTLMNTKFGSTPSTPDAALALLANVVPTEASNAKFATGSYTGTGAYGASNPTTVNVGFPPKMFVLYSNTSIGFQWLLNMTSVLPNVTAAQAVSVSSSGNTITWYSTHSANDQENVSGRTYYWFAIGG